MAEKALSQRSRVEWRGQIADNTRKQVQGISMTAKNQGIHGVWKNRWTFILAATGSAVGLGNIWKFPYITGENGGGAFVLMYLACILVAGIPVMMAEVLLPADAAFGVVPMLLAVRFQTRSAVVTDTHTHFVTPRTHAHAHRADS